MDLNIAKKAIDFLISNNSLNKNKQVTFFGGEPLLYYKEIIVPVVEYCNTKKNYNFYFSLTTNGTLLDKDKIAFFKIHNFKILFSLDGNEYTQNLNRISYNQKENNNLYTILDLLLEQMPNNFTIRSTITENNCQFLFQNFQFFYMKGIKSLSFFPDIYSIWKNESLLILKEELKKITEFIINNKIYYKKFFFSPYMDDIEILMNDQCGINYYDLTIDYLGNIYCCQDCPTSVFKKNYIIGNLENGIDLTKQINLIKMISENNNIQSLNKEYCLKTCNISKEQCKSSFCHFNSFILFHNYNTKNFIQCYWENLIDQEQKKILFFLN